MFRVKICGITRAEDMRVAVDAGADAIGLNFVPGTPRCLGVEQAAELARRGPEGIARVGVFVNASPSRIREIAAAARLTHVQLHGDETPRDLPDFLPAIRAFRLRSPDLQPVADWLQDGKQHSVRPVGVLLDAYRPGVYGGTGAQLDWEELDLSQHRLGVPVILAGGLTEKNVAEAIARTRPQAVDVASGVELAPGVKSPPRVRAFVRAALEAFADLSRS